MQASVVTIILITSVQSVLSKVAITKERLPAPEYTGLVAFDPHGLIINWKRLNSDLEPVLGYKVRLWEAQDTIMFNYKTVNGRRTLVKDTQKPKLSDFMIGEGKLSEYVLRSDDQTQLVLDDIKEDTPYLIQILAFGPSGDGIPSADVGIELHSRGNSNRSVL